jgi:bifunctional DNase/RNase
MPRPLTHDLFLSVLGKLGITIERIEVTDLKEGTFYSKLILGKGGELIAVDARPSDSIALAVRVKCPVFVAESIIDEAGIPIASISEEPASQEKNPIESERKKLTEELEKLVEQENYEEAARIRDLLKELEKNYPDT